MSIDNFFKNGKRTLAGVSLLAIMVRYLSGCAGADATISPTPRIQPLYATAPPTQTIEQEEGVESIVWNSNVTLNSMGWYNSFTYDADAQQLFMLLNNDEYRISMGYTLERFVFDAVDQGVLTGGVLSSGSAQVTYTLDPQQGSSFSISVTETRMDGTSRAGTWDITYSYSSTDPRIQFYFEQR
ncbi:hypothetical protein JW930_05725 [Candidatus Woesearchaeota archaeon]|nr:hypothetical protein [Candidatus Woesearchaeota archaeon]